VPGCHATGFIVIMYPLVRQGIVPPEYPATCFSLTGYSGGGKKLIATYEDPSRRGALQAPRPYALSLWHKHLPEMQAVTGLKHPPIFQPVVGPFYQGMIVSVPLVPGLLARPATREQIHAVLGETYEGSQFIRVLGLDVEPYLDGGFLDATVCNGTNNLEVLVFGNHERILAAARFDNLGKGASGACVQCLNLMLGVDEASGL
jgi:N-acetyl-gamma-glutamyl-phosphate reductase